VTLHRFSNSKGFFYTTDRNDAAAAGHSYDGPVCYLPAGPAVKGSVEPIYRWVRK
jgi:hypothetical protein